MATLKQWETLAEEAIADAGYWKKKARQLEREKTDLRKALHSMLIQFSMDSDDLSKITIDKAWRAFHESLTHN